jgi:TIR domain
VGPNVLFNEQHIYDFVETQKAKLKKAYEALPDDEALDEIVTQNLKRQYILVVPILKPDQWEAEERPTETVVYVPFEGDPSVFKLSPSASNGTIAVGQIVGHDLLITVGSPLPNFDVAGYVKREIAKVEWRLNSLRGSTEYLNQQLEIAIHEAIASRKRRVENKAKARQELTIPRRRPVVVPQADTTQKTGPQFVRKEAASEKPVQQTWDIFMSHASKDKPYVEPLVDELVKAGVTVWYDKHVLGWGDPLRPGINKGLINSRYAIVVLSKAFLAERKWTEHELRGGKSGRWERSCGRRAGESLFLDDLEGTFLPRLSEPLEILKQCHLPGLGSVNLFQARKRGRFK